MKKLVVILIMCSTISCSYQPRIDTAGRSGTFEKSKAEEITNDLQHCEKLAKENSNLLLETPKYVYNYYFRAYFLYLLPERELTYPAVYRKCMENRGHSVIK